MDRIRLRRDLADLPEPRFLHVTPAWRRRAGAVLSGLLALAGGAAGYAGLSASAPGWAWSAGGAVAMAAGAFGLWRVVAGDWRDRIDFAAALDGLYLPGRQGRAIFVPWPDVTGISVVRPAALDGRVSRLKLTLRLAPDGWTRFPRFTAVRGDGAERSYTVPAFAASGEELAAGIQSVRARLAPRLPLKARG